jgi:hypothetical protein
MTRPLFSVFATLTLLSTVPSQGPSLALVSEPWGTSCGPTLTDGARSVPIKHGFGLSIGGARPNAPLVLVFGDRASDLALPGSVCRLLTMPTAALPLQADADGGAEATYVLPFVGPGSLYAQVLQLGTPQEGVLASRALAIHALPSDHTDALLLARVEMNGGTQVRFLQPQPGEVLVVAKGSVDVPKALVELGAGRLTPVEVYETLSGQRAPDVLSSAVDAAARARREADGVVVPGPASNGGSNNHSNHGTAALRYNGPQIVPASCFSSSWFRENHCGGNSDFEYCWTDLTGNPWVQRDCRGIWGVTASVSGTYVFEYRYHDWQGWHTGYSTTVNTCEWYYAYGSGSKRDRRVHVLYGTGNVKHFSVRGFN